jgi:hypothetical protein
MHHAIRLIILPVKRINDINESYDRTTSSALMVIVIILLYIFHYLSKQSDAHMHAHLTFQVSFYQINPYEYNTEITAEIYNNDIF